MLNKALEDKIRLTIQSNREIIRYIADYIYKNPEICFQEFKAVNLLTRVLEDFGFSIKKGFAGLETSFRAEIKGKTRGPRIALIAEYDSIPKLGHACGHHLIAAGIIGTAISLAPLWSELKGELIVIGTPAEEGGGGKTIMLEQGGFKGIELALSYHPAGKTLVAPKTKASFIFQISINNLGSSKYDLYNLYQEVIKIPRSYELNITNYLIKGAVSLRPSPEKITAHLEMSADDRSILESGLQEIIDKISEFDSLPGINATIDNLIRYEKLKSDPMMAEVLREKLFKVGICEAEDNKEMGATDMGNISQIIPCLCPLLPVVEPGLDFHSKEFLLASNIDKVEGSLMQAIEILAHTVLELVFMDEKSRRL